jgi:hypothetical protein
MREHCESRFSSAALEMIDQIIAPWACRCEDEELDDAMDIFYSEAFQSLKEVGKAELIELMLDGRTERKFLEYLEKRLFYVPYGSLEALDSESPSPLSDLDHRVLAEICRRVGFYACELSNGKFVIDPERMFVA